ncbi:MAG: hypothetical protein BGO09_11085 [Bacteroidetes bacterium 47-18]|nr:MAG: hypothetical protein BGO09_11085 [Bacteroidetes bacterium 47-18]
MPNKLDFTYNWQDITDTDVQGQELIATWASLRISYNDEIISELIDRKSDTVKDNINLPLYPLAEWIVLNWWFLLYEPFTPNKIDLKEYESRHNLSYAREGYALPNLSIKPIGDLVLIEWRKAILKNHKLQFLRSGQTKISVDLLQEDLFDFVDKVVNRLDAKGISGTLLQQEWESIHQLTADEIKFCKISASASIDPFNVTPNQSDAIIKVYNQLPNEVLNDFFIACNPINIQRDASLTMTAISRIKENKFHIEKLDRIHQKIQSKVKEFQFPWIEGYEAARELRKELKLNGHILKDFNDISHALKVADNDLNLIIAYEDLPNSISVVSGVNDENSPFFVLGKNLGTNSNKTKFAYCRALYDYFFSSVGELSLVTKSHIENQKRNRAFAAEFLVPAEKLRKEVSHEIITEEEIEDIADKFYVDPFVIKHQIENHHIAQIEHDDFY